MNRCPECGSTRYHFHAIADAGWRCADCGPKRIEWPAWMQPLGHSQVAWERTPGGGEDEGILQQT